MKKNGYRKNKRFKILLVICGLAGLIALPHVTSYTYAAITNRASVRITDTTNALIAVNLPDSVVCFSGNEIKGYVTNNMGVPLREISVSDRVSDHMLSVGAKANLSLAASTGSYEHSGTLTAKWENGSATVPYIVDVKTIDTSLLVTTWDLDSALGTITNNTGYNLQVIVAGIPYSLPNGEGLSFGQSGNSTTFSTSNTQPEGGSTNLTFLYNNQYDYIREVATPLPPPSPVAPEELQDEQSLENKKTDAENTIPAYLDVEADQEPANDTPLASDDTLAEPVTDDQILDDLPIVDDSNTDDSVPSNPTNADSADIESSPDI